MVCRKILAGTDWAVPEEVPVIRLEDLVKGESLGQGISGITYKGSFYLPDGEVVPVAIKEYIGPDAMTEMDKEARVLHKLNGTAGAPRLHGVLMEPLSLVMELCAGVCYDTFMNTASVDDALKVFIELVSEVKALHHAGYCHCDLHGGNIIISDTPDLTVRLIDFGLSEKVDEKPHDLAYLWTTMDSERLLELGASIAGAVGHTPAGREFREATLKQPIGDDAELDELASLATDALLEWLDEYGMV
ncbi:tyrosine-protein kinase Fes/Fps-like [Panulirus ornatus]|uniref:tyrosine-protein kinase Fes/Fps-like n=1 Tax=Panulirus ornatus TaxID=150431 RepID=UPI003A8929AB